MRIKNLGVVGFLALLLTATGSAQIREKQLSSTFTDDLIRRDGSVAFTANQPMGTNRITGLASGIAADDAATVGQINAASAGLRVKEPVRVATEDVGEILDDNASLTAAAPVYTNNAGASARGQITAVLAVSGTFAIDGITLVDADRVLIGAEGETGGLGGDANGCWTVGIVTTALTLDRCADFDEDDEVISGAYFLIREGSVHGAHSHVLSSPDPLTVGGASGSDLNFVMFNHTDLAESASPSVDAGDAGIVGTSSLAAREDHQHAVSTGAVSTQSPDAANAEGTSTNLARADHIHNIPAAIPGTTSAGANATEGTSTSFARADHVHATATDTATTIGAGDAAAEGTASSFSRSDHVHGIVAADAGTISPDDTAAEGTADSFSRSDHQHAISAATAVDVSTANGEGSSSSFARADHLHDSPTWSDANKNEASLVVAAALLPTGLTIASTPALDSQPKVTLNGIAYPVGDNSTASAFYYSGNVCITPRATAGITAGDFLCVGSGLGFTLDTSDNISQYYPTFTNN